MEKKIKLTLGGEERTLDFEGFWFTKHYQKLINGKDLTNAENLEAYIIAGLKATYSKARKQEDFKTEDVENWLGDMPNTEMAALEKQIVQIITSDVPGEVEAPADGA